jgi:hypothetical protein
MRERIHDYFTLWTEFLPNILDSVYSPSLVLIYLAHVRTFLIKLFLLIYITEGQLARISEILTIWHCNSSYDEPRNIFIKDGLVTFIIYYYKGYVISGE